MYNIKTYKSKWKSHKLMLDGISLRSLSVTILNHCFLAKHPMVSTSLCKCKKINTATSDESLGQEQLCTNTAEQWIRGGLFVLRVLNGIVQFCCAWWRKLMSLQIAHGNLSHLFWLSKRCTRKSITTALAVRLQFDWMLITHLLLMPINWIATNIKIKCTITVQAAMLASN